MHHNPQSVERNVLCGINDAREFAINGVIVLNRGGEMQVTRLECVRVNHETHWVCVYEILIICGAMCLNK